MVPYIIKGGPMLTGVESNLSPKQLILNAHISYPFTARRPG
jgi:hypothetical protein